MSRVEFLDCHICLKDKDDPMFKNINWQQDLYNDPNISVIDWHVDNVLIRTSVSHFPRIQERMENKFNIVTVKKYKVC